jgi:cell division protein FtsW (lipid II flippase)
MRDSTRAIAGFAAASLAAVAAGCVAMAQSGVAPSSWSRSLVAWVVGGGLAALLTRYAEPRRASTGAVVLAIAALTATLFSAGVGGVHRWLDVGPLHINAAALFLPALIVALAAIRIASVGAVVVTVSTAAVLLAQPDASQLTSFAFAACILVLRSAVGSRWKALAVVIAVAFVLGGWMRPDPTTPVAEVEQIFTICAAMSPILPWIAGLALAAAALVPLAIASVTGRAARDGALALSAYFVAVSIAPFCGWFPVPLVGLGMSFPIGWWLGVGLLAVLQAPRPRPVS